MYLDYWQLERKPFENSPDSSFFFYSEGHRAALEKLTYAARERKSLALLTGEHGCGKTTLVWALAKALEADKFRVGIVNNPRLTEIELLNEVVYQLGEDRQTDKMLELSRMMGDLLFRAVEEDQHTVVIIDEAQLITDADVMEQLRLLLNYQLEDRCMLTLVLSGQPELGERVRAMPQLDQRVAVRHHLTPLGPDDTRSYIEHRLRIAGRSESPFTEEAIRAVCAQTGGVPRRINNVCDLALMEAARQKLSSISADLIRSLV